MSQQNRSELPVGNDVKHKVRCFDHHSGGGLGISEVYLQNFQLKQAATLGVIAATDAAPTLVAAPSVSSEAVIPVVTGAPVEPQCLRSSFGRNGKDLHGSKAVPLGQENLVWNTDPIETVELEDLTGQTAQCLHNGEERHESQGTHAHVLPEA